MKSNLKSRVAQSVLVAAGVIAVSAASAASWPTDFRSNAHQSWPSSVNESAPQLAAHPVSDAWHTQMQSQ